MSQQKLRENEVHCSSSGWNQSPDSVSDEERHKLIDSFLQNAHQRPGGSVPYSLPQEIPWFSKPKFELGIKFSWDYFLIFIAVSGLEGAFAAVGKPVGSVLFRNYNFYPTNVFLNRGASSLKRFMSWTWSNLSDKDSIGAKQLITTRHLHNKYAKLDPTHLLLPLKDEDIPKEYHTLASIIQADLASVECPGTPDHLLSWHPILPFSQLGMAIVQFSLFNVFWIIPVIAEAIPLHERRGHLHLWAVFGRSLGMEDEYNFALYEDGRLYDIFFQRVIIPLLKGVDASGAMFLSGTLTSFKGLSFGLIRPLSVIYFAVVVSGGSGKGIWDAMSWKDKAAVGLIYFGLRVYLKVWVLRVVANWAAYGILKVMTPILLKDKNFKKNNKKACMFA